MKKISLIIVVLFTSLILKAQHINKIGIGTKTPGTNLDVVADATNPNVLDGITIPKLTCSQIIDKTLGAGGWNNTLLGTIIYITGTTNCSSSPPVSEVNTKGDGFYILLQAGDTMEFVKVTLNTETVNDLTWFKNGNTATNPTTDFIGSSTNTADLVLGTNSNDVIHINPFGQIGISNQTPKVTLDLGSKPSDPSYMDGFSIPSLTCDQLTDKQNNSDWITNAPAGTVIYIENASCTATPQPPYTNIEISGEGLYVFDGNEFIKLKYEANVWSTTGNIAPSATPHIIGTIDAVDFVTRTNNLERMRITATGNVGINTSSPSTFGSSIHLDVHGKITNGGFEFILGNTDQTTRGNSGASRALVKDVTGELVLNYNGDFNNTRIDTPLILDELTPNTSNSPSNVTPLGRNNIDNYITSYPTVKHTFFNTSDVTINGTLLTIPYTPTYENSTLIITCDALYRLPQPTTTSSDMRYINVLGILPDAITAPLPNDPTTVAIKYQRSNWTPYNLGAPPTTPVGGGGTRSSTLFPITGKYINTDTDPKYISMSIQIALGNGISFDLDNTDLGDIELGINDRWLNCHIIEIPD